MRNFLKTLAVACLGLTLGLVLTHFSVNRGLGFGAVRAGPWTAWPRAGSLEIDPYGHAALSRTGEAPLGLSEGLSFIATTDSAGRPLDGGCVYSLAGKVPPARYWTVSAVTPEGRLIDNAARRYGFTSSEILRRAGGAFAITLARDTQPGNWLPTGEATVLSLVLRVYDSPVSATASTLTAQGLPSIERAACP